MKRVRVLIADDSATVRSALVSLLSAHPEFIIVGQAVDGVEAVQKARALRPDVITMDVNMPRLDGLGATAAIMTEAPSRVLVICSVTEDRQLDLSFRAMAAGALELIEKPRGDTEELRRWGERVAESVRLMAEVPVVRRHKTAHAAHALHTPHGVRPVSSPPATIDLIALVASTGGPPALANVLSGMPDDIPVPILIAQHIAPGFTAGLVRWFGSACQLRVKIAAEGEFAVGGTVYLPPDGFDLGIDGGGLLRAFKPSGLHCPSGNRLLHAVAKSYGSRAAGVVLTGMGDDGAQGLLALKLAGGATYAQDEETSVVYGMPQVAWTTGAASAVLPLDSIAPTLLELCSRKPRLRGHGR